MLPKRCEQSALGAERREISFLLSSGNPEDEAREERWRTGHGGQAVEALSVLARTLNFTGDRKSSVFKVLPDFLLLIFS